MNSSRIATSIGIKSNNVESHRIADMNYECDDVFIEI